MTTNLKAVATAAASYLLWLSLLALALVTALWMADGGRDVVMFGVRVNVTDLRPWLFAVVAMLALRMMLDPAIVQEWAEQLQNAPHMAIAWGLGAAATLVISGLKMWQHYAFFTCAYDLAVQTSVSWNTANGHGVWDSLQERCYLGDHFSPIHLLLAPLMAWAQSGAVLLLVQCVALGLAVPALYLLCLHHLRQEWLAVVFAIFLIFNPYLHHVSHFDFHPAALAIPLFLWMMYFADTDRWAAALLLAILVLLVEETVVPPLAAAGLYIVIFYPRRRILGGLILVAAATWFVAEVTLWMPMFRGGDPNNPIHVGRYINLGGDSYSAIARNLSRHPWVLPRELLQPEKIEGLFGLLLSVGLLPLLAPRAALLMLVPALIMSASVNGNQYMYFAQYSSAILPFVFYAAVAGANRATTLLEGQPVPRAALLPVLMVVLLGYNIDKTPPYMDYWSNAHVAALYQLIGEVPPQAAVSSTQYLMAHLSTRERASVFGDATGDIRWVRQQLSPQQVQAELMRRIAHPGRPSDGHDLFSPERVAMSTGSEITAYPWTHADYLLLEDPETRGEFAYPLDVPDYRLQYAEVRDSPDYELVDERDGAVLLRRLPGRFPRFSHPASHITQ